jgi:hypothetical protein
VLQGMPAKSQRAALGWHYMKLLMTRWNAEPLKWRGLPCVPIPFSPVQRARKFCEANRTCRIQVRA